MGKKYWKALMKVEREIEERKKIEKKQQKAKERNYKRAARRWNGKIKAAGEEIKKLIIIDGKEFDEEFKMIEFESSHQPNLFPPNNNNKFISPSSTVTTATTKQQYTPTPLKRLNNNNNNNNEYRPTPMSFSTTTTTEIYVPTPIPQLTMEESDKNNNKDNDKSNDLERLFEEIESMECDPEDLNNIMKELNSLTKMKDKPKVLKIEDVKEQLPDGPWIRKHNRTKVPTNK